MTELTDKLEKLIQQAALDGALTEDAVSQFHSLVVERNALKDANVEWEESDKQAKKEIEKLVERCSNMQKQILLHTEREAELEEREKKITEMEVREECTMLRIADHQEMFRVVFRNAVIKRDVLSPQYDFTDSNGSSRSSYPQKGEVEEEEK